MNVIEAEGLTKRYVRYKRGRKRETVAVAGLDMAVPSGGVFGFLGPNGSGKTTTIRCLLGLVRPTSGSTRLLGADSQRDLASVIRRVGSIVEAPALYPGFTGRRNLELLAGIDGIRKDKIQEKLELVDLADRASDRVKTYSLGMRQRLGIAASLLRDPEVLILDEPANGLDPAGIKEVRDLVRRLGAEGRTVFVSSHLLSEVRQMCDEVAILARGRCVAIGPVEEVLSGGARAVFVRVDDLEAARSVLARANLESNPVSDGLRVSIDPTESARVTRLLAADGLFVSELRPEEADLETVFLELTRDHTEEDAP
ncbi:MAG: type transport system ATP-binding protein [Actinomycetota bacterium]|nr:type transport system ATP-binding protein [Actinomycetota bacterium]